MLSRNRGLHEVRQPFLRWSLFFSLTFLSFSSAATPRSYSRSQKSDVTFTKCFFLIPTEGGEMFLDWEQHSVVFSTHMKTINKKCGLIHFPTSDLVLWILPHCDRWGFHQSESSLPLDHPPDSTWLTPHTTRIPTAYHRNIKKLCWGWGHMDDFPLTHIFHSSLPCCSGSRKIHRELQLSNPCTTHMPSGPTAV